MFKARGTWRFKSSATAGCLQISIVQWKLFQFISDISKSHSMNKTWIATYCICIWTKVSIPGKNIYLLDGNPAFNTYMYWSRNDLKVSMKRESFWSCVTSCEGSSSNKHFRASRNIVNTVPCFLCRNDSIASSSGFWVLEKNPLFLPETQSPPLAQREQAPM